MIINLGGLVIILGKFMDNLTRKSLRSSLMAFGGGKGKSLDGDHWLLNRYHDESYTWYENEDKGMWQQLDSRFRVIVPESTYLFWWDRNFLIQFCLVINYFEIPIVIFLTQASHSAQFNTTLSVAANWIIWVLITIHIFIVRPHTGFYSRGVLITNHRILFYRYAGLELWLNLFGWASLLGYLIARNYYAVFPKLLFYLTLYDLYLIDSQIQAKLELLRLRYATYRLGRLLIIILWIVIWLSGIYFYMDYQFYLNGDYPHEYLWLTHSVCSTYGDGSYINLLTTYPWYVWLNYAAYWTLQTISGVGYGDMTPRNPPEVVYCCLVDLLMTILYAFFINAVWEVIGEVNQLSNRRQANRQLLRNYQKEFKVPSHMSNKLGSYLFEVWRNGDNKAIEEHLENTLSEDLKNELFLNYRQEFFWQIPLFSSLTTIRDYLMEFLREGIFKITERRYAEQEIIFKQGDIDSALYFVLNGEVHLYYPNTSVQHFVLGKKSFGAVQFFTKESRAHKAIARKFCTISCLTNEDLVQLLRDYPTLYEKYCELMEKIKFQKDYGSCGETCWQCQESNHRTHHCPTFFNLQIEIRQQSLSKHQSISDTIMNRRKFLRRNIKSSKTKIKLDKNTTISDQIAKYTYYRPTYTI